MSQADIYRYATMAAVFIVIFGLRARRMSQLRPLKLERLWIVPAIYLVIAVINIFFRPPAFAFTPPTASAWLALAIALVVGAAIGWQRGRMMQIHVDPETHALNQKGSPLAILFLLAIIAVKMIAQGEGRALGFDVALVTDAAFAFGLGLFTMTRVEMYLRAKRMLEEARGGRMA
ncbi:CcdC protein domain-containing protein [Sphingomonas bacterium]|uniref:CcdC protein domain-containing protein n=1 Tax=Sphingomonas bacterium TaxID=1895847 RepID=UPI002602DAF9|nr:CcdC protein domain-containing protein [Sphingomonas bacterium]MDB5677209.1 hypothetical protein [Sphingomonas bacterium]